MNGNGIGVDQNACISNLIISSFHSPLSADNQDLLTSLVNHIQKLEAQYDEDMTDMKDKIVKYDDDMATMKDKITALENQNKNLRDTVGDHEKRDFMERTIKNLETEIRTYERG